MVDSERNLTIHEAGEDEEFGAWLKDLADLHPDDEGHKDLVNDHHLVLVDEIGEWIGGVRYSLRGGVAHLAEIAVVPHERSRGHALRLLNALEEKAREQEAHLLEFWTDSLRSEPHLENLGWRRVVSRPNYFGRRIWHLFEKSLQEAV